MQTGLTALHVAAHYGQMDFVRDMLSKVPATIRSEPPHSSDGPLRDIGGEVSWSRQIISPDSINNSTYMTGCVW